MAKRDIKVNYDALGDTLGSIGTYRKALEEFRDSVDKVNDIITASNDAETIDKLEKRYKKAKKRLDECYEELDALYTLIDGYIDDMTAIIRPKKGLTRVGRNDIYWNLQSIWDAVDYITDVQFSYNIWYSSGLGKTEEEKQAMERNYNKLQTEVWGNIFTPMKREVSASLKKLQGYYDHEVVDYENKDDSYKLKAVKVRYQYSSVWELFKQNGIDYVESNWKLIKGAVMAVVDLLKGLYSIGNMIYYYNSGKTAAIVMLISPDPPKWAEETLGESEDYFGNMTKAITHPVETLEAMAQNLNDTYEVEGLEYMGGYVIGDIVVGEISAAAVSKAVGKGAGAVDDIGNIANKADDVADIAETAGKMDDVVDAARTAEKTGDVAEAATKGGKASSFRDLMSPAERARYDQYWNDKITSIPKGSRPDPSKYLSKEYIDAHLAQFEDGISIIMTEQNYEKFVMGNDFIGIPNDGTQFVLPKNLCDDIATQANGSVNFYEKALGFDDGHFRKGGGLVRIDVDDVSDLNLRIPSGNEYGANNHWIPGGYTDGGVAEAISDLIPNKPDKIKITEIKK